MHSQDPPIVHRDINSRNILVPLPFSLLHTQLLIGGYLFMWYCLLGNPDLQGTI